MDPAAGSLGVKDGDEAITLAPYSCTSEEKTVSLEKDCLVLVRKVLDSGWVYVVAVNNESKAGYFPGAYLKKVEKEPAPAPAPVPAPAPAPVPAPVPAPAQPKPVVSPKTAPLPEPISPKRSNSGIAKPLQHQSSAGVIPKGKAATQSRALPPSPRDSNAALPTVGGGEEKVGAQMAEYVGEANNRFQDYVMMMSRLTNKYKTSLEAQTKLMDANNDLAICLHEFGKKLAATLDDESAGEEKLGTCMMKVSEVLMAQERLKSRQRAVEQEMMQHFMDFLKVSAPRIRSQKDTFDKAQQQYLDASVRLREMGMSKKTKLENIKDGEKQKAITKQNYHQMTVSLLETLGASAHEENAALLDSFSKWLESTTEVAADASAELQRDVGHTMVWREVAKEEKSLIAKEKGKFSVLLTGSDSDKMSAPGVSLVGAVHPSFSTRVTQDPVQKLLDRLIRDERKFVHGIVSIKNLYLAEYKKDATLLSADDERKIFLNIADIIEFHQRLLKALEKAYNCWPFPHLAGLFLDQFKMDVFWMYGDYIRQIAGSRATLKMVKVRKEQWKSLSKTIQQRHDIAPLSELLASPQYRLGVYVTFFEDYLAAISETEPDYNPAVDTLQHFEECYEDILDNAANASKGELERFGSVVSGLDLCRGDDAQYTKRSYVFRGKADVKSLQDPKYSANYLLLLSDQLVCCQKEKESKSSVRLVNNLYLYDVEVKESPNDSCKFMVSTSGGAEYVFSVQESKEKKQWYFHLKHLIQLRTRRFKIIGVPLPTLIRRNKDRSVPSFMEEAITILLENKQTEGLFRLSGEKRVVAQAIINLNQGKPHPFEGVDEHSVAGVLKQFFRDLPEPLLTYKLSEDFLSCVKKSGNVGSKAEGIAKVVDQLPRPNRLVLMFLMKLLHDISLESDTNKMNCRNLSIVFGPNLIRGGRGREVAPSDLSEFPAKVVEVMIEKFSTIFARAEQEFQVKFDRTSRVDQGREVRLNDYRRSFRTTKDLNDAHEEGEEDEDDEEGEEEGEEMGGGAALGTIVKEGWLTKKGDVRRNWTRRWFVLKYGSLAYFKTQDGVHAAGRIVLVDCLVGQSTSKKPNCFAITTPSKRTFLLTASSPREQAEWMQAIQGCIETSF